MQREYKIHRALTYGYTRVLGYCNRGVKQCNEVHQPKLLSKESANVQRNHLTDRRLPILALVCYVRPKVLALQQTRKPGAYITSEVGYI